MDSGLPVKRVLFVIPDLQYSGAATQLSLLAAGLPKDRFGLRVAALGPDGPVADGLRAAGVAVEALAWNRWIDGKPFWRLRRVMQTYQPHLIHAWRYPSLRVLFALRRGQSRVAVSAAESPQRIRTSASWLDRWLLRRADLVIATNSAEQAGFRQLGLGGEKLALVVPGVPPELPSAPADLCRSFGLAQNARPIVCVGPLEPGKGFREAVWAFDILKFLYDHLHLVLIGDGPDRGRLVQFAQ